MIDFRLNLKGLGGCHYVTCIFNPLAIFVLPKSTFDGFLGYAGAVGKYVVNAAIGRTFGSLRAVVEVVVDSLGVDVAVSGGRLLQ